MKASRLAAGALVAVVLGLSGPAAGAGDEAAPFTWRNPSLADVAARAKAERRPAAVHVVTEH
jgi:hypothetical protein